MITEFEEDIKECVKVLNMSGVILYPTDTIWGLGCNAMDANAIDKIFKIKQRTPEKSMIVLLAEADDILQCIATPNHDIIRIIEAFETPTTVIYQNALGFPHNLVADDGSIAIRVTTDPFCKALIKRMKHPLVSTSANISGTPSPAYFSQVNDEIVHNVDYVVKYRQNDTIPRTSSRLVRIADDGHIEILRP